MARFPARKATRPITPPKAARKAETAATEEAMPPTPVVEEPVRDDAADWAARDADDDAPKPWAMSPSSSRDTAL